MSNSPLNGHTGHSTDPENLVSMDNDSLIDLLAHQTQLLVTASIAKPPDRSSIQKLKIEVEAVQKEIKRRMESQIQSK